MSEPVLRTANAGDADALLALWSEADAEPTTTDDAPGILALLEFDPGAVLVAEDDGRLVGSVIAAWDGWRGSIYRLAVAPPYRRRGLAGRLVNAAEERLAGLGARRLQAIVVATDERAVGFWSASGWQQQAARHRFVTGEPGPSSTPSA